MSFPLFLLELRRCAIPTVLINIVQALYTVTVVSMYDPELGKSLEAMRLAMPELFSAFGMTEQGNTLLEFAVNYLYGFLFIALPIALVALLSDKLVTKRLDDGSTACLLAQPISRTRIILTQFAVLLTCLILTVSLTTAVEFVSAEILYPGETNATDFASVNSATFGLWLFFAGACWLSSCAMLNTQAAKWIGTGICSLLLLVQMLSGVDDGLSWLGDLTPLALFDPLGVANADPASLAGATTLAAAGVIMSGIGMAAFSRRDLSV